jgi:hypothetical protein
MRETDAPPLPKLYELLADALGGHDDEDDDEGEDTDPLRDLPFSSKDFRGHTRSLAPQIRPPAPGRMRTHAEYQTARFRDWWFNQERPVTVELVVGSWVDDELLDSDDSVVVDVDIDVAAERLRR